MPVVVVTDSTAYLPEGLAERYGIHIVPLHVLTDGVAAVDGVEVSGHELVESLRRHRLVTTSRPTPEEFTSVFRKILARGADAVVSVHLSGELSGTWESAVLAAREVGPDVVRVVDSRSAAMGLGFAALHAAHAAQRGESGADVEGAAVRAGQHSEMFFAVETLEYLRRGGRIGAASALLGTALAVKPILGLADGRIVPMEKVRTMQRALSRLVDLAVHAAGEGPVELAVHHLGAPRRAAELANLLDDRLPRARGCAVSEIGAVIGAHTGPGVLGVVVQRGSVE